MKDHYLDPDVFRKVQVWANFLSEFYQCPVYLVGSSLHTENYRDIDICCVLNDDHFKIRYCDSKDFINQGMTGSWKEGRRIWAKECSVKTLGFMKQSLLYVDMKVIPEIWDRIHYFEKEKFRLDSNPNV